MTYGGQAEFPVPLRADLERICASPELVTACRAHELSPGGKLLDAYVELQLRHRGYETTRDVHVARGSRFDVDVLVDETDWSAAIAIEGGQAARIDLDLLRFIALAHERVASSALYGVLLVSDKVLLRSITGASGERAFDYARRLRPLFLVGAPPLADLLVLEFDATPLPDTTIAT